MADFVFDHCPGSRTLVVAFTSYGADWNPPTKPEWRGTLARLDAHRLFLIDHAQHWFHSGVRGFSSSVEETCERIAALMSDVGAERLVTLGSSMGGYAAAVHGAAFIYPGHFASATPRAPRHWWRPARASRTSAGL